ncbi:NHL repeat-containing protein [Nocardioides dubius]|uniref:NHL repeat-containing protein n=1 Tax=Nocardioides dubius TaxID=317019 RepID=A0ABP4EPR1_9ACTN
MKKSSALLISVAVAGALAVAPVTSAEAAKPRVSIKVSDATPVAGSIITVTGKVRGASAGKRISLQKKVGKRWKKVDSGRVSKSRTYSLAVRVKSGRHVYRTKVAKQGRFKTAVSRTVAVRARKVCVRYGPSKMKTSVTTPRSMAVDLRNGSYYVADAHRVRKFAADGTLRYTIGGTATGTDNRSFNAPTDVEVDKHGNLYVTDMHNYRVQKYSSSGTYLMSFGTPGVRFSGGYPSNDPASVPEWRTRFFYAQDTEVRDDGLVYVLDNYHVKIYNPDGTYRAYIDLDYVSNPEEDDSTAQMELDALGDLYVAYSANPVVVRFNDAFKRAGVIRLQRKPGWTRTWGLALTRQGTLMVNRSFDSGPVLQEYTRAGTRLRNLRVLQYSLGGLARGRGDTLYSVSFSENSLVKYSATKRRC